MRIALVFTFFILSCFTLSAATLSGRITNEKGKPLPYSVAYIKGTTMGVTANDDGKYSMQLEPGSYEIVFQYVGYQKKVEKITVANEAVTLNVTLQPENYSLKGVTVYGNAEDPAYRIIRAAIKRRKSHLELVSDFSCKVYIKGVQVVDSLPKRILGLSAEKLGLDSSQLGIVYLSESESEYSFRKPDKVREIMISSKVSGDNKAFSYNQASDFDCNFYKNLIEIPDLSERGFIFPISESALFYYKYELVGTVYEEGETVNKIKVIPKRRHDPVFSGYIYIVENNWRIHSTDLYLTKDANIDFVDSLEVKQTFNKVADSTYMPFNQTLLFTFKILGIKGHGRFVGVFNNYNVHPDFPKHFFKGEEMKVNEDANKKDSVYWNTNRPIPLTQEEVNDYRKKDSLSKIYDSKKYLDSMDRKRNRFGFSNLLTGYYVYKRYTKTSYYVGGLTGLINYNTVEGWAPLLPLNTTKTWENNKQFSVHVNLRYGIHNQLFSAKGDVYYLYNPEHSSYFYFGGGKYVEQFNGAEPISPLINSIYTLVAMQNYMKLYDNTNIFATYGTELVNGINVNATISYSRRSPLENTTDYTWSKKEENTFTPNYPDNLSSNFTTYKALEFGANATFHIKQRYYTRPHQKIILGSKYPVIKVSYKKGVDWLNGAVNFDQVEATVSSNLKLGLFGHSEYSINGGFFPNSKSVGIVEMKHFNGNQTILAPLNHMNAFQLLPYYLFSTSRQYAQFHFEHHFEGFLLNKIPLIRNLKLHEVAGFHYLYTPAINYAEVSAGLENIFKVFRVDFVASYSNALKTRTGVLVGIDLLGGILK